MKQIEQSFLATLLYDERNVYRIMDLIKPEHLSGSEERKLYNAMLKCIADKEPIDEVNVYLKDKSLDASFIASLTLITPVKNIVITARKLYEYYVLRELSKVGKKLENIKTDDEPFEVIKNIEQSIFELTQGFYHRNYEHITDINNKTLQILEEVKQGKKELALLETGFYDLDKLIGGFRKGDLIILAGRPSMGKTALALNMANQFAQKHTIAFNSLEMSNFQLNLRLLSFIAHIKFNKLINGYFNETEAKDIMIASSNFKNIYLDDTPSLDIFDLEGKVKRLKIEKNIDILIVDYLQLLTDKTKEVREQEISSISRRLKGIAKELNIVVIALAQMNRGVEARTNKRPMLSDLRESGAIEQDADLVLFIHRPEYYGITILEDGTQTNNLAQLIVAKNRNGLVGEVKLLFDKQYTIFKNYINEITF
ncbi:MAG: replicative DNA helicase [Stygiobacter sp.]